MANTRDKKISKLSATIVAVVLLFQIFSTPNAHALVGGVPIVRESILSLKDNFTSTEWIQKWIINPAVRIVIRALLQATTQQVVGWIQGGGGKNVGFVGNITQALRREGDLAAGEFLNNLTGINLCGNIGAFLRLTLRTPGLSQQLGCSLTDIVTNVDGFYRNFQQGGWKGFFQVSLEPQNNPNGAYLIALDAKILAESKARERIERGYSPQVPFLGLRVPVKKNCRPTSAYVGPGSDPQGLGSGGAVYNYNPIEQIAYATKQDFAGIGVSFVGEANAQDIIEQGIIPESFKAPTVTEPEQGGRAEEIATGANNYQSNVVCDTEYDTKTPGTLITDTLSKSVGSGIDFAVNAKDFDEAIATIINALISKVISSTFAGDDGQDSGDGLFNPSIAQIPLNGIENAFTFITRINEALVSADQTLAGIDSQLNLAHTKLFQLRRDLEQTRAQIAATSDPDTLAGLRATESSQMSEIQQEETKIANLSNTKAKIIQNKIDFIDLRRALVSAPDARQMSRVAARIPQLGIQLASFISDAGTTGGGATAVATDVQTGTGQAIGSTINSINSTISLLTITINEADRIASTTTDGARRAIAESQRDALRQKAIDLGNKRAALQVIQGELSRATREADVNKIIAASEQPQIDANQEIKRSMDRLKLAVQALK